MYNTYKTPQNTHTNIQSVSYTHLDVYKRQPYRSLSRLNFLIGCQIYVQGFFLYNDLILLLIFHLVSIYLSNHPQMDFFYTCYSICLILALGSSLLHLSCQAILISHLEIKHKCYGIQDILFFVIYCDSMCAHLLCSLYCICLSFVPIVRFSLIVLSK